MYLIKARQREASLERLFSSDRMSYINKSIATHLKEMRVCCLR